jgi:predicted nucleic acid-binding protein
MLQEYNIVIADTSCFILLDKINEWSILQKVFQTVITTEDIAAEFGRQLPDWVQIMTLTNKEYQLLLQLEVDNGEASAIALSIELGNALLVLDDYKARKLATKLHLAFTGTLGIILKAKQSGIIPYIRPVIEKIQLINFRFSEKNYKELLLLANE